jgi:hypothetical protein
VMKAATRVKNLMVSFIESIMSRTSSSLWKEPTK